MFRLCVKFLLAAGFILLPHPLAFAAEAQPGEPDAADLEYFEKHVRPVLVSRCFECHGPQTEKPKGGLRLDSRAAILAGGDTGAAIVPGKPDESLLIDAVNYGDVYQMPPKSKLPSEEIAALTKWVERGAAWPKEAAGAAVVKREFDVAERRANHWAWQPVRRPAIPAVQDSNWPADPIDHFILARLEEKGLTPAAPADRRTLIRRLYFDLVGLPPDTAEVESFAGDDSPLAMETLVDRLLASPHFGERWARHWLDLVRYAESRGHEYDAFVPNAHEYRDYLIRAFNADLPYDQLVREHIAGDLMREPRPNPIEGYNESILGTGFWFLGEWVHSPVSTRRDETDRFDNMLDVMGKTFLGLTIGCARCHDHKFDAISEKDYYALAGFLQSSHYRQVRFETQEHNREVARRLQELRRQYRPRIVEAVAESQREVTGRLAEYLRAAREAIFDGVESIAPRYQLDRDVLAHWVDHLHQAKGRPDDPLHVWAALAHDRAADEPGRLADLVKPVLDRWKAQTAAADSALGGANVMVDYSEINPRDWMTDGPVFGSAPVRPGDVRWGDDPAGALAGVFARGAARRDPIFSDLKLREGTQSDFGRLKKWDRAGHTLATPTFTIETGRLHYMVQGSGVVYCVVDSHLLNDGPLHAGLIHEWKDDQPGEPRWIAHDLRRYQGHRAHLEFSAPERGDLSILMVVDSEKPPGPIDRPNGLLMKMLDDRPLDSTRSLAEGYQALVSATVDRLADDRIANDPNASDYAALADWMLRKPELWIVPGSAARARVAELSARYIAAERRQAAEIRRESRTAMAMLDGSSEDEHLLIRGSYKTPGELVPRRFLEAIAGPNQPPHAQGSGRLALADQMLAPFNPFVSRVMVNRLWHHLFGRGIVPSVDNFGVLGQPPTHPELLDHLASQFVDDGWSIKRLIRRIVLSRTYQMASTPDARGDEVDPTHALWHRRQIRRLEGEAIRDSILAISGRLNTKQFGPSVPVHLTPFMQGRGRPESGPLDGRGRRSIYISIRRNFLSPMMLAFDTPIPLGTVGKRNVSNVPAQALILMNDPFVVEQVKIWTRRLLAEPGLSPQERISRMYLAAFARPPSDQELTDGLAFLSEQARELGIASDRAMEDARVWADLGHVLINVKEFYFIN